MDVQAFKNNWLGKRIDYDGVYGYQCVDLAKQYLAAFGLQPGAWGNAKDYWYTTAAPILTKFDKVAAPATPQAGDIVVYGADRGFGYGHITVATSATTMLEQNGGSGNGDGVGSNAIRERNLYSGWVGLLRPKGGSMATDRLTREDVIEIHRAYFIGDPGQGYGWEHVGKPLEIIVRDFKNSIYRKNVLDRYYAFDSNQQTIAALNGQIAGLNDQIRALSADDAADQATIDALKTAAEQAQKVVDDLNAKNVELKAEADKLKGEYVAADSAGKAFLLWLGQQLSKLIPGGK